MDKNKSIIYNEIGRERLKPWQFQQKHNNILFSIYFWEIIFHDFPEAKGFVDNGKLNYKPNISIIKSPFIIYNILAEET